MGREGGKEAKGERDIIEADGENEGNLRREGVRRRKTKEVKGGEVSSKLKGRKGVCARKEGGREEGSHSRILPKFASQSKLRRASEQAKGPANLLPPT